MCVWFWEGFFPSVWSRKVSVVAPEGARFVLHMATVGLGHRRAAAVLAGRGSMGKVCLRLRRGSEKNPPPPPQSLSSREWGALPALAWCPLPASTAPSMPGPGWSLVQEEKLQKAVSALESRHLTKNKPPRRDDPCCGQKRVLRGLNAKGLALLDRPALWGTQVQAR